MRHSVFLSALILSVSTIFCGCNDSSSNTPTVTPTTPITETTPVVPVTTPVVSSIKQPSSVSGQVSQTIQTTSIVTGYSADKGTLSEYIQPAAIGVANNKLMAIYMVGSDLETNAEAGTNDLNELVEGYNNEELTTEQKDSLDIVVAFGGSDKDGWRGMRIATMAQLIEDSKDGIFGNLEGTDYSYYAPEAHMGDETSLTLFMQYIKDAYTDDGKKVLTMWDHGSAYGSFGNDSNFDGDGLTMAEMDNAFATAGLNFFDIIGYDACLNANFELASITSKYASYHIGSEELEPGHGWNYKAVITSLAKNSDLETYGTEIIDNYVNDDSHDYKSEGKTLSMVKLSEYAALKTAVDALATYVGDNLSDDAVKKSVIQSAVQSQQYGKSSRGDKAITIDLKGFSDGIAEELDNNGESALTTDVNTAFSNYVVHAANDGTRPNSYGVSIVPPEGYDDYSEAVSSSAPWYAMTTKMQTIISGDTTSPTITGQDATDTGATATFDDTNLKSVKTIYGNIITESDGTQYFASVATLPATKTSNVGEYFTPTWNQEWYMMYFGEAESDNTWLSMQFENTYTETGVTYKTYSAEIEYIDGKKDYSAYPENQKYDYAKLTITVDESNNITLHSIRTYKIVKQSASDETGNVLYDKASYPLKAGDKIKLLAEYFNMKTFDSEWFYESDLITIAKTPTFELEKLQFTDDKDLPLAYYYMMIGTDIAGNWVNTQPVKVK